MMFIHFLEIDMLSTIVLLCNYYVICESDAKNSFEDNHGVEGRLLISLHLMHLFVESILMLRF